MKKILFAMILMIGMCFASCGNTTGKVATTDSTTVDSDSVYADSVDITIAFADSVQRGLIK